MTCRRTDWLRVVAPPECNVGGSGSGGTGETRLNDCACADKPRPPRSGWWLSGPCKVPGLFGGACRRVGDALAVGGRTAKSPAGGKPSHCQPYLFWGPLQPVLGALRLRQLSFRILFASFTNKKLLNKSLAPRISFVVASVTTTKLQPR